METVIVSPAWTCSVITLLFLLYPVAHELYAPPAHSSTSLNENLSLNTGSRWVSVDSICFWHGPPVALVHHTPSVEQPAPTWAHVPKLRAGRPPADTAPAEVKAVTEP